MSAHPLPHHDGSPLYVSTQTPRLGDSVTVRLRVPQGYPRLQRVIVRSNPDHEPHWDTAEHLGAAQGWDWWQAEITVSNPDHRYRWMLVHDDTTSAGSAPTVPWVSQAGTHHGEVLDACDFRLLAYPAPPAWLSEKVMYQIFPDRFAVSEASAGRSLPGWAQPARWEDPVDPVMPARVCQFYGGDLDGIAGRLDHLESLGVGILYLTPFFPGASNHRYDASSFMRVDPLLGGEDALIRLVEAAHARDMKVIGDLTTNHSGDGHEWFQRALAEPDSAERSYYYFDDEGNYESWLGTETLPKFNWASQQLREAFIEGPDSVVAHWLKPPFNLDGWRIDVANMTGRLGDTDLNAEVRQILRRTMEQVKPDSVLLAESTNDATSDLTGDAWHGAMTYPSFTRPLWSWLSDPDGSPYLAASGAQETVPWFFGQPTGGIPRGSAAEFAAAVDRFNAPIPWRVRLGNMHPLDTHDTARFSHHAAPGTVQVAVGLQMTLPGLPTLFAGDEFGLTGADGEISRTPIPWARLSEPEVADRVQLYRQLISLRQDNPALRTGSMRWLHTDHQAVVFLRESEQQTLLVLAAAPASGQQWTAALPSDLLEGTGAQEARLLFGSPELRAGTDSLYLGSQGPCFAVWELSGVVVPAQTEP